MAKLWFAFIAIAVASIPVRASHAQVFPPGTFVIDGYPVSCGGAPTVLIPSLPDAAMNNGQAIAINPIVVQQLPTVLKLFTYAHECGHFFQVLMSSVRTVGPFVSAEIRAGFRRRRSNFLFSCSKETREISTIHLGRYAYKTC